jgi:segregation and condensation protein B
VDTATRQGLEALLFLADEPIDLDTLAAAVERDPDEVEEALIDLAAAYEREQRGMVIRRAAGGWRMYTAEGAFPVVERHVLAGRSGRLTQAALETLAVIAYKQPLSRQEISDIRGVNADAAVRSLVARGFVEEVARDEGPGQAVLYGTTTGLLERLGIDRLEDLPPLTSFLPEEPAPDEPDLAGLKEARKRLAAGEELPSRTSRLGGRDTNTGRDDSLDDDAPALPPVTPREGRREADGEMEQLTGALERAARNAMAQLREAVAATHADEEAGEDEDAAPTAGDGPASDAPEPSGEDERAAEDTAPTSDDRPASDVPETQPAGVDDPEVGTTAPDTAPSDGETAGRPPSQEDERG